MLNELNLMAERVRFRMAGRWVLNLIFCLGLLAALPAEAGETGEKTPDHAAPTEAQENRFNIFEYAVEGNTLLPVIAIEQAVYPHLGERRTIADVQSARESLERAYRDGGYPTVFVDIPEQKVDGSVVRLRVTEGSVERLRVSGATYYSLGFIKARVPSLAEGSVPYFPDVQKQLAALATARDRKVTPVLRAGRTPGKVEVDLKVEDELPLHGSLEANNYYSANTEHARVNGMLRYDNLWQRGHSVSLQYQATPTDPNQSNAWSGTYVMPGTAGNNYAFFAIRSRSNVSILGDYGVVGNGDILGMRWIRSLPSKPGLFHSLTFGMDYKHSLESIVGSADSVSSPVTYLSFIAQYSGTLAGTSGVTQVDLGANFSLRGLLNNEDEFQLRRYNARSNYFYWRGDVMRTQKLGTDYSLYARLDFQLASGPLIGNEQFTIGGAQNVRGYLEGERLGDDGLRATLELRGPRLAGAVKGIDQLFLFAFVDAGYVRVIDPLPGQTDSFDLSSAGLGLRLGAWKYWHLNADFALPLQDGAYTLARHGRAHLKARYEF
ncbi:MAG: ShlB/FhaC/HecB family hemolysin secretion/activation protein [Thiobacillus sp.]